MILCFFIFQEEYKIKMMNMDTLYAQEHFVLGTTVWST